RRRRLGPSMRPNTTGTSALAGTRPRGTGSPRARRRPRRNSRMRVRSSVRALRFLPLAPPAIDERHGAGAGAQDAIVNLDASRTALGEHRIFLLSAPAARGTLADAVRVARPRDGPGHRVTSAVPTGFRSFIAPRLRTRGRS